MKQFFLTDDTFLNIETGSYIPFLVIVSYIVASYASYTALDLANHISKAKNESHQKIWHLSGAFAMGAGIWSMHFIGMLAYKMDMAISYSTFWTALSIIPALVVSYFVLQIIKTGKISFIRIFTSAVLLGIGICLMHYTGMFAMQMDGDIFYKPIIFAVSVIIAITASGAALIIAFFLTYRIQRHHFILKILAALIMGLAICGMHYAGMAATVFSAWADCRYDPEQSFIGMALSVALVTFIVLSFALFLRMTMDSDNVRKNKIGGIKILYIPVLSIFILGASISSISAYYIHKKLDLEQQKEYRKAAEQYSEAIESRLQRHTQLLNSIKTFYDASTFVDRNEFKIVASSLLEKFPELISLHYVPKVKKEEIDIYTESATKYFKEYKIKNNSVSLIKSEFIYPVLYTEPQEKYKEYIGYNLASDPDITDLLQNTLDNYDAISGPDIFSFLSNKEPLEGHFTLLLNTSKKQGGENDFTGLLISRINVSILLNNLNNSLSKEQQNLSASIKGHTEHSSSTDTSNGSFQSTANVADKTWDISYVVKDNSFSHSNWEEFSVLIGGTMLSLMIASYAFTVLRQKEKGAALNNQLNAEKTYLNAILENMRQGVFTVNEEGIIQTFNNWAETIFGYKRDEVIDQNLSILMPEAYNKNSHKYLQSYKNSNKEKSTGIGREVEAKNKNGKSFPIRFSITEITIGDNIIFIGLAMDITEQKEKERLLNRSRQEAEQASAAKSDFLANMSHELRTPLNSIIGLSRMLFEDSAMNTDNKEMVGVVSQSANNLLEIVNDILDISKIESGNLVLEEIGFDFMEIAQNAVNIIAPIASEKGISLEHKYINENIPYIIGDPFRIGRILINLISNAVKYTIKGKVEILLDYERIDDDSICIKCSVIDTGVGIPEDKLNVIFEKFTQADISTTREFGGTGLGLAITKELVELMNGEIGVTSTVNKGSCFWFKITFKTTDNILSEVINNLQQAQQNKENRIKVEDAKILVAEDHPMNQNFIKRLLKHMGFINFEVVDNGQIAVQSVAHQQYDLILMDCHMPEKNGYEATTEIRKSNNHIPIIALTADVMKGTKEKCLKAGMNYYIGKPIDADKLKEALEQWIEFPIKDNKNKETEITPKNSKTENLVDLNLLSEYADNEEDLKDFVNVFIHQSLESIDVLTEFCVDGECKEWVDAAHKLKSGAGLIGAKKLYLLCSQAQEMNNVPSKERDTTEKQIRDEYVAIKEYLNEHVINK